MPGQKPPDGLPPLSTPEPLPVPPLPLPLEPPGDVPPLPPLEPPAVDVVVELLVVVVVVVGCVVDVDVVDDRVVVGWGFGIVRVVVGVVSAWGTCVAVVGSDPPPQPAAAVAAATATRHEGDGEPPPAGDVCPPLGARCASAHEVPWRAGWRRPQ